MSNKIPISLTSLIHHIHLNEANWWERGIREILFYIVWIENSISLEDITKKLKENLSIEIPEIKIEKLVEKLLKEGLLVKVSEGLTISEQKLKEIESKAEEAEKVERLVEEYFNELVEKHCLSIINKENLWEEFNETLLQPLIKEIGAKTYELISGSLNTLDDSETLSNYLKQFSKPQRAEISQVIRNFLDPKKSFVRSYILRQLNAHFFIEATNLTDETINSLLAITKEHTTLRLILDTNIIFSSLGFHDNPFNEAVESLNKIIRNLKGKIDLKLYITPITYKESLKSLNTRKVNLSKIRFTKNIAEVFCELEELSSGITKKYAESVLKNPNLTPEKFFGSYLENFPTILRGMGIEIYNDAKVNDYNTNLEVLDDVNDQMEYEKRVYRNRQKSYEKMLHDMALWRFVKDLRPAVYDSPLEAKEWVVTIDGRLLRFDEHKRRKGEIQQSVCIHPTALVQMLQFWIPRTEEFEEAVVTSLQIPFIFQDFDPQAEKITSDILETISFYEGIEDMPKEVLEKIVLNDSIRGRIKNAKNLKDRQKIIKDPLTQEYKNLTKKLGQFEENEKKLTEKISKFEKTEKQLTNKLGQFEKNEEAFKEQQSKLNKQIKQYENKAKKLDEQESKEKAESINQWQRIIEKEKAESKKLARIFSWVVIPLFLVFLIWVVAPFLFNWALTNWDWVEPYQQVTLLFIQIVILFTGTGFQASSSVQSKLQAFLYKHIYEWKLKKLEPLRTMLNIDVEK